MTKHIWIRRCKWNHFLIKKNLNTFENIFLNNTSKPSSIKSKRKHKVPTTYRSQNIVVNPKSRLKKEVIFNFDSPQHRHVIYWLIKKRQIV